MRRQTSPTDSEVCVAAFYWKSRIHDRRKVICDALHVVGKYVRQHKCDAGGIRAFTVNGVAGNEDMIGPANAQLDDVLNWLRGLDSSLFTAYVNSHYGRKDKPFDHNWHVELNNRADILYDPSEFALDDWYLVVTIRRSPNFVDSQSPIMWVADMVTLANRFETVPCYGLFCMLSQKDCLGASAFIRDGAHVWSSIPRHLYEVEDKWSQTSTDPSRQVRGVYWGNFFGPSLVHLMKSRGDILARYDNWQQTLANGTTELSPHKRVEYFDNGTAFLALTESLLDDSPTTGLENPHSKVTWPSHIRSWLTAELRSSGLLKW